MDRDSRLVIVELAQRIERLEVEVESLKLIVGAPPYDAETRQILADERASVATGQWDTDALA